MSDRLNYYFRQKVTEAELDEGFALLEAADHNFTTDLDLVGIARGLTVTQRGAGANLSIDIAAGVAYDKNGARANVPGTQNVDVSVDESSVSTDVSGGANSKIISVFLKFQRVLSDPRTDGNSVTVYFSETEGFTFVVRQSAEAVTPTPVALDTAFILLADITRAFGQTTIVNGNIGVARREDTFVRAGTPYSVRLGRVKDVVHDIYDKLNVEDAAMLAGDAAQAAALAAHIASATAHAAGNLTYAGSGFWADGATSVPATDLETALDDIVADLAASGDLYNGATATSATYLFGLSGGTIRANTEQIRDYLDKGPRGAFVTSYAVGASPVTLAAERQINVDTSGGVVQLNLPAPSNGLTYWVKDATGSFGTNKCILHRNGGEKIEGVAGDRDLTADFGSYKVFSDGTDWFLG